MNKETLIDAVSGISDRFIDEYAAATEPAQIKKRRLRRVLKLTLIPAACLCLALRLTPIIQTVFGGAHNADPDWDN